MPPRIKIRADAGVDLGSGHIRRCLTLAEQLRARGAEVTFVARSGPGDCIALIESAGFGVLPPSPDSMARAEIAIVDHYGLDAEWERTIENGGAAVVAIDDLANRMHSCAVLLDQNITATIPGRYDRLVSNGCKLLLGPKYALLRTEFHRAERRERLGSVHRVAVSFGGFDHANATSLTIRAILQSSLRDEAIDVVLDQDAPHAAEVRQLCAGKDNLHYRGKVNDMAALLSQADLAIGACGVSQWERAYLGVPVILVTLADNQLPAAQRCAELGVAEHAGRVEDVSVSSLAQCIDALVFDKARLQHYSQTSLQLMGDGCGTAVVADCVLSLAA